jgi:hypothetical protein
MRRKSSLCRALAGLALAVALVAAPDAVAKSRPCVEKQGPAPQRDVTLRELESSVSKPTLTLALKGKTERENEVRLPVKGGESIGKTARAASVEMIEKPVSKTDDLDAMITVAAAPTQRGRSVTVSACVTNAGKLQAGQFKGLVEVSGTRFKEFQYAIVVTQRYTFWFPVSILAFLFLVVVISEVFRSATEGWSWVPVAFIAGLLLVVTYFGQYVYNDTWGDNLFEQISALLAAAATAVATARATATKFLSK